ncbi:MAG: hypothetical protein N3G20_07340, partial [Verrucomicrobiae bacterium]|nr:hypothetical protein [Verrucomicrobiae bacterium]
LQAGALLYNVAAGTFAARTNAAVKFPLAVLAGSSLSNVAHFATTRRVVNTNDQIEIHSQEINHFGNRVVFGPMVRVICRREQSPIAQLRCAELSVLYSNRVETVDARERLVFDQYPYEGKDGVIVERHLTCEKGFLVFGPDGNPDRLSLEENVAVRMLEHKRGSEQPLEKLLCCDSISVFFERGTNIFDRAVAHGNVTLMQGNKVGRAQRACYNAATGTVVLTGEPVIQLPDGEITGASRVCWEQPTGKYTVSGRFISRWKRLPLPTNNFNLAPDAR